MHSGSTVIILAIVIFANAPIFGQSLEAAQLESKSIRPIQVKYKLLQFPVNISAQSALDISNKFGKYGYVVKDFLNTTLNGSTVASVLFINIDNSRNPYHYRSFIAPTTSAKLLKRFNEQGARGFRYQTYVEDGSVETFICVQDASRPSAKYTYRQGRCVSNLDELFAQINKKAADGYRLLDSLPRGHFCVVYIKDTSEKSKFVYKMVPNINNPADLLTKADQLGADGYRYAGDGHINLVSSGTSSVAVVPLYYRDETQKSCTFSYSSAPLPESPSKILSVLQKQETKGFIYLNQFSASNNTFLIFVKYHNCPHIKRMNIDAYY